MSFLQAILIGALQGVTELFPVSSLGHSVLVPAWLGWDSLVAGQAASESFYLSFLVGLHVATAIALLIFFRKDWARIIRGFFTSIRNRRIGNADERMA
ncbi:MAG: undecaprenyl-diphosphate phosphatase, partial [Actinomycetota bacterium]